MVDAIVLAGSANNGGLRDISNAATEGLIEINNKLMVEYVLDALLASKNINRVVLVGLPEVNQLFQGRSKIVTAPAGVTPIKSLINGLEYVDSSKMVLVVTDDIPLISPEAIDYFLEQCRDRQADLFYPIIEQKLHEEKYPGSVRTYVKLKEGTFTGGNIFLINPEAVPRCADKVEEFVRLRKKPFDLCRLVGFTFLLKFLLRMLSLKETETRVSSLLGITGYAVVCPYPEVGFDVDKPSDLELARQHLAG